MRAILAPALALVGCSSEAPIVSSDVSTRDMSISVDADGDAARTHVSVSLTGPGSRVHLMGDDRLILRAGGVEVPLSRYEETGYVADLAPGTTGLALRLAREAPETTVDLAIPMPPATAVTVPATAPRAGPLTVGWTPAAGPHTLTLALSGACIPAISRPLSIDAGSYIIQPADMAGFSAETCDVTVTLTRALAAQSNEPPLQHMSLSLTQVATTVFESTP